MQFFSGRSNIFALWPVATLNRQPCDNPACPEIHTVLSLTCAGSVIGCSF